MIAVWIVAQQDLLAVADAAAGGQGHQRRFVPGGEAARPGNHAELGIAGVLEVAALPVDDPAIGAGGPQRSCHRGGRR